MAELALAALAARVVRVTSLQDPRLADYRNLREAELAIQRGAFIAESEVVLRVLLTRGRFAVRSILLAESRLDKLADALLAAKCSTVPIYVARQELLNEVVGFRIHRGILAAGERVATPTPDELLAGLGSGPRRIVLLEGLTNHDNVGGVFRNAAAFEADAVLIDHATCDPLYRKAIRVSVGAALLVPYARAEDSASLIAAAKRAGFSCIALSPRADAADLAELRATGGVAERVALMLGTEGAGLSQGALAAADLVARIDIAEGFDSLNVATASGIALHAIRNAQRVADS